MARAGISPGEGRTQKNRDRRGRGANRDGKTGRNGYRVKVGMAKLAASITGLTSTVLNSTRMMRFFPSDNELTVVMRCGNRN